MFTGIVEEVGVVARVDPMSNGRRISIRAPESASGLELGDSVAVDGVCQTVVERGDDAFTVEAIGTTLSRTTFERLRPGSRVNLERALALGDRLGGHMVQGHVDGVGEVRAVEREGEHVLLDVWMPNAVAEVSVLHGSIAVNGVSLTINALRADDVAQVALIPFTWTHTNLRDLSPGEPVNLEGDLIGKFVVNHMRRRGAADSAASVPAQEER